MNRSRLKQIAWIALAALLFSALSPAMASVLFSDRPDILARVLALPAAPVASLAGDICHATGAAPGQPSQATHSSNEDSGHTAHGIVCSFCLVAGSLVTLPVVATATASAIDIPVAVIPAAHAQHVPAISASSRHSRDPPIALR
jgi:hypothetical protein